MVVAGSLREEYTVPAVNRASRTRTSQVPSALGREARVYLLVLCGCFLLFAVNALLHGLVTVSNIGVHALAKDLTAAEREREELELELAFLASYPRIAAEAETRLAMRGPQPGEFRFSAPIYAYEGTVESSPVVTHGSGLVATLGGWLKDFGRAAASTR